MELGERIKQVLCSIQASAVANMPCTEKQLDTAVQAIVKIFEDTFPSLQIHRALRGDNVRLRSALQEIAITPDGSVGSKYMQDIARRALEGGK